MARHFPHEIHVGQRVLVRPAPTEHPIEAIVTFLDTIKGMVIVEPIGYAIKWAAYPRAIMTEDGMFLHYEKHQFMFKDVPTLS